MKEIIKIIDFGQSTIEGCFTEIFNKIDEVFCGSANFKISFIGVGKDSFGRFFEFEINIYLSESIVERILTDNCSCSNLQNLFY